MSTETKTLPAGTFCWVDLGTTDAKAAKKFYTSLFNWETNDIPMGDGTVYTMCLLQGKMVAGIMDLPEDARKMGAPPNWLSYVQVTDADEAAKKAESLGARLIKAPFDAGEHGRMAVILDPTGAVFAVWQPKKDENNSLYNQHGALTWNELATNDTARATDFYTGLFGWTTKPMPMGNDVYTVVEVNGRGNGGIMTLPDQAKQMGAPPHWLAYFAVNNADGIVARVQELGGKVYVPPMDIPGVGRFSVLADPQGAVFAIIKTERA